jgi:hypothetical protein
MRGERGMGFVLELANAGNFGMPDVWDFPEPSPRHRKPPRRYGPQAAALAHGAMTAAAAAARRASTVIATRPALADHRRAF